MKGMNMQKTINKYWETKAFKKKQNKMIRFLMKGLRKYGYSVKVAN